MFPSPIFPGTYVPRSYNNMAIFLGKPTIPTGMFPGTYNPISSPVAMTMLTYLASCVSTVLLCIISSIILLRLQHVMWRSIIRPYVVRFPVNFANVMQDATRRDNGWNRADVVFHLLSQQTPSPLQPPECILDTQSCPAQPVVKVALVLRCAWSLRVRFHYPGDMQDRQLWKSER